MSVGQARAWLVVVVVAAITFGTGCPARIFYSHQCQFNHECGSPNICASGFCSPACEQDRDCTSGWVCRLPTGAQEGTCVEPEPPSPPQLCNYTADCRQGETCRNERCAP